MLLPMASIITFIPIPEAASPAYALRATDAPMYFGEGSMAAISSGFPPIAFRYFYEGQEGSPLNEYGNGLAYPDPFESPRVPMIALSGKMTESGMPYC